MQERVIFGIQEIWDENSLKRKNKAAVILKTGCFDNIDLAVIINSVCKAVQNCKNLKLKF